MKLFGLNITRAKNIQTKSTSDATSSPFSWRDVNDPRLWNVLGLSGVEGDKLNEATYLTCRRKLAEAVGKLPLKIFKETDKGLVKSNNSKYNIIRTRPNRFMGSAIFWNTIIGHILDTGNSYIYINDAGDLPQLIILDPLQVRTFSDYVKDINGKGGLWYIYTDITTNKTYKIRQDNMLHFRSGISLDGINGLSIPDLLKLTIDGSLAAQSFINKNYNSGLSGKVLLESSLDLNKENSEALIDAMAVAAEAGNKDLLSWIPIPPGVKANPLGVKLTDAQFLELKKYTALQIAAAFGITPDQINNYEKSSYSSSEAQQHAFYVETLMYILKHIEDELTMKILTADELMEGYIFKFNVDAVLRADIKSRAEAYSKMVSCGAYTPAEIRELENLPYKEGSDVLLVNSTLVKIDNTRSTGDDKVS